MTVIELPFDELMARLERIEAKLDGMTQEEVLWDTREAARYLGCTEETIRVKVRAGQIPVAKRVGTRMRFEPSAIKALRE